MTLFSCRPHILCFDLSTKYGITRQEIVQFLDIKGSSWNKTMMNNGTVGHWSRAIPAELGVVSHLVLMSLLNGIKAALQLHDLLLQSLPFSLRGRGQLLRWICKSPRGTSLSWGTTKAGFTLMGDQAFHLVLISFAVWLLGEWHTVPAIAPFHPPKSWSGGMRLERDVCTIREDGSGRWGTYLDLQMLALFLELVNVLLVLLVDLISLRAQLLEGLFILKQQSNHQHQMDLWFHECGSGINTRIHCGRLTWSILDDISPFSCRSCSIWTELAESAFSLPFWSCGRQVLIWVRDKCQHINPCTCTLQTVNHSNATE